MPLTNQQLTDLVTRARQKAMAQPPAPAVPAAPKKPKKHPAPPPSAQPEPPAVIVPPFRAAAEELFPIGWFLGKESWHFHRRFFRVFRRPMAYGEYGQLLRQVRAGHAERLDESLWRVTLSGEMRIIRADRGALRTILPKDWEPAPQPSS